MTTLSRRTLFQAAIATGVASVVGLPPAPVPAEPVITLETLLNATRILEANNVPPFANGNYAMFLHPVAAEDIKLDALTVNATYRVRETALSIMHHERRREKMGKRGHVTAAEVFARANT